MADIKNITIKVNSKAIDLNPFTQSIFGNTIEAMVTSLRLEDEPKVIEIVITK